jgi:hypothetical protein
MENSYNACKLTDLQKEPVEKPASLWRTTYHDEPYVPHRIKIPPLQSSRVATDCRWEGLFPPFTSYFDLAMCHGHRVHLT